MNGIENDGRAMEVRDGYGKTRTFRRQSGTSFRGRANQWMFTRRSCCNVPLPHGHGSALFPPRPQPRLHFPVAHPYRPPSLRDSRFRFSDAFEDSMRTPIVGGSVLILSCVVVATLALPRGRVHAQTAA